MSAHNKMKGAKRTQKNHGTQENTCNCRQKNSCPLEGKCQSKEIVCRAAVTNEDDNAQGTFKTRYLNRASSFPNEKSKNATELSKHIWSLKESNTRFSIKWKIIKKCQPYSNRTKRCKGWTIIQKKNSCKKLN